jgi:hypothetical protein
VATKAFRIDKPPFVSTEGTFNPESRAVLEHSGHWGTTANAMTGPRWGGLPDDLYQRDC